MHTGPSSFRSQQLSSSVRVWSEVRVYLLVNATTRQPVQRTTRATAHPAVKVRAPSQYARTARSAQTRYTRIHHIDSPLPVDPRLSIASLPNGSLPGGTASTKGHSWSATQSWTALNGNAAAILAQKPPPGRDPKSRARSREYLKQSVFLTVLSSLVLITFGCYRCLQEVTYLTSPQAMNPLPNRPLIANASLGVTLPNLPSFEQHAFNGRPRKTVPEVTANGPNSAAGSNLDRGMTNAQILPPQEESQRDKDPEEPEAQQLTAIFRPDEDWRAQFVRGNRPADQTVNGPAGTGQWDDRPASESHEDGSKEEEEDNEVEDAGLTSDSENGKVWRARRTLRK